MFTLYLSDYREREQNTLFPHVKQICSAEDLTEALKKDNMFSKMRDNYRNKNNFLQCDCIAFDIDNGHSEEPETWKTADDIAEAFPVNYILVRSRNYMKPKRKTDKRTGETVIYEAREKWHVYMPLAHTITDPAEHTALMKNIQALFPLIDAGAMDCARFFYGVPDPVISFENNGICIDEYIKTSPEDVRAAQVDSAREYIENICAGRYAGKEAQKIAADICQFLQIENPLADSSQSEQQAETSAGDAAPDWIAHVYQTEALNWLENWAADNGLELGRRYDVPSTPERPHTIAICVDCPWSEEHTEDTGEAQSVILVEDSGKYGYLCRHGHCNGRGWAAFRAKVEENARKRKEAAQTPAEGPQEAADSAAADPAVNNAGEQQKAATDDLTAFLDKVTSEAYRPYKTELPFFDKLLGGGLIRQTLTMIMAAPGAGKTTLAQQIAEAMAEHGKPVIYLNLEMPREQMLAKAISCRLARKRNIAMTTLQILQGYNWTDEQRKAVTEEIESYKKDIYPNLRYNPDKVTSDLEVIREYLTRTGAAAKAAGKEAPAVIIDYIHLITSQSKDDIQTLMKKTVTMLKDYARDFDTVCLAISATNRESNKGGQLTMESGRDSSNIEYTGDVLLTLNYFDVDQKHVSPGDNEGMDRLKQETWRRMILRVAKGRLFAASAPQRVYFNSALNCFYGEREWMPACNTRLPFTGNKKGSETN